VTHPRDIIDPIVHEHLGRWPIACQVWVPEVDPHKVDVILVWVDPDKSAKPRAGIEEIFNLRGLTEDQTRSYLDCGAHALCLRAMRVWHLFG